METPGIIRRSANSKTKTPWQLDTHAHPHHKPQRQSSSSSSSSESTSNSNSAFSQLSSSGSNDQALKPHWSPSSYSGGSLSSTSSIRPNKELPATPPDSQMMDPSMGMPFSPNERNRDARGIIGVGGLREPEVSRLGGVAGLSGSEAGIPSSMSSSQSKSVSVDQDSRLYGLRQTSDAFLEPIRYVSGSASPLSAASQADPISSGTSTSSTSNSKSKNEIFAASSPKIIPAPRLPSSSFTSSPILSSNSSTPSKTGAFFSSSGCGSWSSSSLNRSSSPIIDQSNSPSLNSKSRNHLIGLASPTPAPPPRLPLPSRRRSQSLTPTHEPPSPSASNSNSISYSQSQHQVDSRQGHVRQRPSLGRQNTEEREKERARIRSSKAVEFRLRPTKEYCLGEGRHCNVFLGAWRRRRAAEEGNHRSHSIEETAQVNSVSSTSWSLCAVKRLHPDRESNLLGLDEAFALRRLGPHPHIVGLIDIKDEVNIGDSESPYMTASSSSNQKRLGKGYPSASPISAGPELVSFATSLRLSTRENSKSPVLSAPVKDNLEKPFGQFKGVPDLKVPIPSHARSTSATAAGRDEAPEDAFLGDHLTSSLAKKGVEALAKRSSSRPLAPEEEEAAVKLSQVNHRRFVSQPVGENAMELERKETNLHLPTGRKGPPEVRVAAPSEERSPSILEVQENRKASSSSIETNGTETSSTSSSSTGTAIAEKPLPTFGITSSIPTSPSPSATPLPTPQTSSTPTPTQDPPRLLILLELLPFSLSIYARKNPEMIDLGLWMRWSRQLASTLAWMHEKGCVHADIKKENVLLTEDLSVKLCDFNSALFPNPLSPPSDGLGLGTPAYGAPELTKAFSTSTSSSPISFKIDVWSLGAVLYSLAVGAEPFSRARSMMDMMHRKRVFFQSEEDDRIARLSVEKGWGGNSSNHGSASTSRTGSLRGRKVPRWENKDTKSSSSLKSRFRREGSTDSLDSVSSSITNMTGRSPSINAINALLNPNEDESSNGLNGESGSDHLVPGWNVSNHHRTSSLGKAQARTSSPMNPIVAISSSTIDPSDSSSKLGLHLNVNLSSKLGAPSRPTLLKRSTSYNDQAIEDIASQNADEAAVTAQVQAQAQAQEKSFLRSPQSNPTNLPPVSPGGSASQLHRAVTAAFAQASRASSQSRGNQTSENLSHPHYLSKESIDLINSNQPRDREASDSSSSTSSSNYQSNSTWAQDQEEEEEEEEILEREKSDSKSYLDGSPALILPGGGRLPEAARNLLARMLNVDPIKRPTAREVFEELEKIQI